MPNNNSAALKAANHANQMFLYRRSGVIASLRLMNQQLRELDEHLAVDDAFIDAHKDLDFLRDELSTRLVTVGRAQLMPAEFEHDKNVIKVLERRLECFGSANVQLLCSQFGIEREHLLKMTEHPCHADWIGALLTHPVERVSAALDLMEASLDGQDGSQPPTEFVARPRP